MAINLEELRARPLDPEVADEIDKFETAIEQYFAGDLSEDVFRVMRLNQGIYGQRQGGTNQMVRVKIPHGRVTPEQLEVLGTIATEYSRGWGHLTTRQNVQFHFVQLRDVPEVLRLLGSVGLTSREACGDTVRNVAGCHLAGACPFEVLDITPWAQAVTDLFLRNPIAQRLPRKFKVNFSGCATDCGQAMFNDVGIIALTRPRADGSLEPGFKVFLAGGLGTTPHPAQALEDFTTREDLLADRRGVPAHVRPLRQPRQQAAGPHEVAGRHDGHRGAARADHQGAQVPARVGDVPRSGIPAIVEERGDAPAGVGTTVAADGGVPVELRGLDDYRRWDMANVVRGRANGTVERVRVLRARRHHDRPVPRARPDPARLRRRHPHHQPPELRAARPHRGAAPRAPRPPARVRHARAGRRARPRRRQLPRRRHLQHRGDAVPRPRVGHRARARRSRPRRGRRRADQHLRLHELVRPAPHLRHRLPRHRAARARQVGARLPDAARRAHRQHGDRVRREGVQAAGEGRGRGCRAGGREVRVASAAPARRSPTGWAGPAAPPASERCSRTSTSSRRPTRTPTSTSTSTRLVPYVAEVGDSECAT